MNNNENNVNKDNKKDAADKTIDVVEALVNTKNETNSFDKIEVKNKKNSAILCYLGCLFIIPMIKNEHKNSKYILFHINQGINLFILEILVFIITKVLKLMFTEVYLYSSYTPTWVSFVNYILCVFIFILTLFGIINTSYGNSKELPIIGKYRFLK